MKRNYRSEFNTRQNMLRDNYEIYYYSDSHFQSVSMHKHDYYEFYFPVSGKIEMDIGGNRTPLTSREAVIVPPGTMHRAVTENSERSYCRYVFWISRPYFRRLCEQIEGVRYIALQTTTENRYIYRFSESEYALIQSRLLRLIEEERNSRFAGEDMIDLCIRDLILTISRLVYEHDHPAKAEAEPDIVPAMLEYINSNLEEDLSLEMIGEKFFISKYHVAHIFKDRIGVTVHQYILKKRLERCANDIKIGRSISKIYQEHGFSDYSSFFRAFRKEFGVSPKEFQQVYLHDPLYPGKQKEETGETQ